MVDSRRTTRPYPFGVHPLHETTYTRGYIRTPRDIGSSPTLHNPCNEIFLDSPNEEKSVARPTDGRTSRFRLIESDAERILERKEPRCSVCKSTGEDEHHQPCITCSGLGTAPHYDYWIVRYWDDSHGCWFDHTSKLMTQKEAERHSMLAQLGNIIRNNLHFQAWKHEDPDYDPFRPPHA